VPSTVPSRALGKILCTNSPHEAILWAGHANYAVSKGGVMMLMKTIAQELARDLRRVRCLFGVMGLRVPAEPGIEFLEYPVPTDRARPGRILRAKVWGAR